MATHAMMATGPTLVGRRSDRPHASIDHGTRIGGWRIDDELGRGGMASVHSVVHSKFGKRAALKIAHPSLLDGRLTQATFHREARIVHAIEHPGVIAGTLTYVSPEQIRGDQLTPAADVYALAVLAHHLLCGRPPFASRSELALCHMHLRTPAPRASLAWPDIPSPLDDLLSAMLAKRPEDRPSLDEIESVLRDAAVAMSAPPAPSVGLALPSPPFRKPWIGLAVGVAALAWLAQLIA